MTKRFHPHSAWKLFDIDDHRGTVVPPGPACPSVRKGADKQEYAAASLGIGGNETALDLAQKRAKQPRIEWQLVSVERWGTTFHVAGPPSLHRGRGRG
jgi:hypothetical protein